MKKCIKESKNAVDGMKYVKWNEVIIRHSFIDPKGDTDQMDFLEQ